MFGSTRYTGSGGWFVRVREVLARANALIDLYIIDKQPKFMGPKVPIESIEGPHLPISVLNNDSSEQVGNAQTPEENLEKEGSPEPSTF